MRWVVGLLAAVFLGACTVANGASEKAVTQADYEERWPLTVDSGTLRCEADAVTFTTGGVTYAINGLARGRNLWPDIDLVQRANPELPGTRMSVGPLIDDGLELC